MMAADEADVHSHNQVCQYGRKKVRKFLLTIFWIATFGSVVQLVIMVSASWIVLSGASSFFGLDVGVFITQYVPWLYWIRTVLVQLLGDLGYWILTIPILIIAPVKLILGTIIGLWAYSTAKGMPDQTAYS